MAAWCTVRTAHYSLHSILFSYVFAPNTNCIKYTQAQYYLLITWFIKFVLFSSVKHTFRTIGALTKLEFLDLGGNHLESLPQNIVHLANLEELWLDGNSLKRIPAVSYTL